MSTAADPIIDTSVELPDSSPVFDRRPAPRWLSTLLGLDNWLTGAIFVSLVTITFLGVVMRYVFNDPFVWQEEVQLALFLAMIYLGAGAAFRSGAHVAIDVLTSRLPLKAQKAVEVFGAVVVILVLAYFMVQGTRMAAGFAEHGRSTNLLDIPRALIYSVIPIGMALMIINFVYSLFFTEEPTEVVSHD